MRTLIVELYRSTNITSNARVNHRLRRVHQKAARSITPASKSIRPLYNRVLIPLGSQSAPRDPIQIVLVSPRNPLNIGAAARAMVNFGFSRLAVVAPYAPHWREARSAVGAPGVLQNAKSTECLADAVASCTLVVGTGTLAYRKPEQKVVALPSLAPIVTGEIERGGSIALVFGPEKHGLTRENLSLCHLLVEIPTDPRQPSMNLGQAVAVCLYELASRTSPPDSAAVEAASEPADDGPKQQSPAAPSGDLELLARLVEEVMTAADYSPPSMRAANRHDLRLLLRRLAPNRRDTRRFLGLFRRILWRLKRAPKGN
jgi:tRNA/rRNA methyltransferase